MARRRRVRANGEGTVYERKDRPGTWVAVLVVGWGPAGRPKRRVRSASSRREAERVLTEMVARHRTGMPMPDRMLTVGRYLEGWIGPTAERIRPTTLRNYRLAVRYITADMGTVPLATLTPSRVEALLSTLRDRPDTARNTRDVLKRVLADAMKDGLVTRNAAAMSRPPKVARRQLEAPTADDVRALLAALEDHRLRDMVLVMAATGLRVGEAMGLRWDDVTAATLTVRHQLARVNGEAVLSAPKSARSERTIPLAPVAVAALERQRAAQARERFAAKRIGQGWDTGLVFTTEDGRPLSESTVQYVMAEACKRAGIRHVRPHDLRRWAATVVVATGDAKAAQDMLGHTYAGMTLDRYATGSDASRARAAGAVEEALG